MKRNIKILNWIVLAFLLSVMTLGNIYATQSAVDLGTAGNYVVLTKTGITNTGSHTSNIVGDIGSSPITAASMDNIFCSEITGTIYGANTAYTGSGDVTCFAGTPYDNTLVANAVLDMGIAYADAAGRTIPDATELGAGDISGLTITPGLYKWSTDVVVNTDVTLSGGPTDVWVFQISGDLTVATSTSVILSGGAKAENIFWQVGASSFGATLGTYSTFNGNILSAKQVIIETGAVLNGRALADTQVTLDANTVTMPTLLSVNLSAPRVILGTPGNNSYKNTLTPTFIFKYIGDATASCTLFVDSVARGTNSSTINNTNTAITANSSLSEGSNNWNVSCADTSGNVSSSTRIINIDTTMPIVSLVTPTNNSWGNSIFTFKYTDALSSSAVCTLFVDSVAKGVNSSTTNNTNTAITINSTITQGSNNWNVSCRDLAGNVGNSINNMVFVDSIYPTSLINNINGVSNGTGTTNTNLTINFTASDTNIINWTLSVYNSTWSLLQNWTANTNNVSAIETYEVNSNGTYYVNLSVIDNISNINTTTFTIYVDQSTPTIVSFSLSSSSFYTGDTISGTCTATDNHTTVTTAITGDTSSTGTKTATCTATDLAGNTATSTASYTVSTRPSSGGGGGGSTYHLQTTKSISTSLPNMIEGLNYVHINKDDIAVTNMKISTFDIVENVRITTTQLTEKPSSVSTPKLDNVYLYLEIEHSNLNNSIIEYAMIQFKVEKVWLDDNNVNTNQINLYRYTSGWDLLNTKMISEDSTYYYFESESPGLSYFVIGSNDAVVTNPIIPATTTTPPVTNTPSTTIISQENVMIPTGEKLNADLVTSESKSYLPWIVAGGLLLLLLVILGIILLILKTPKSKKGISSSGVIGTIKSTPFSNDSIYPVGKLEGIGPEYNKALLAMGIENTKQLWETDADKIAQKTGVPISLVQSWQNMAELSCVKNIGSQYSELLERSGVHSIKQLRNYKTNALLKLVLEKQSSLKIKIQGNSPGYSLVKNWIFQANKHKFVMVK